MRRWFFFLFLSVNVFANIHLAPPDFNQDGVRNIYVDFKSAHYDLSYDVVWKRTKVKSVITFFAEVEGYPIFDLVPEAKNAFLDGLPVSIGETTSPSGSKIRRVNSPVGPGLHILTLENSVKENVRYNPVSKSVSSAFWIRDLKERKFLEQYVPSNFEYDQYQMTLTISFLGIKKARQDIFTNGELTKTSPHSYRIVFPHYFTVSCPYFHTTPRGQKKKLQFDYTSINGRVIPVTVYTSWWSSPLKFKSHILNIFKELEADYGPWAHPSFLAYETLPGTGGMEHSGATQTSLGALDHEMLHSYFAKGVMPADGNAGWMDEAIASWRDYGYQRKILPDFSGSNLGKASVYQRHTDSRSYYLGREFMAYLDYRLQDVGGLKAFLKGYFEAYKHTVVTQEHFKNNLEFFSGIDFTETYNTYIWGENDPKNREPTIHPVHKKLTSRELLLLL